MKIKDIIKEEITNEQKLALEQVLNLSKPELIISKDRELSNKELKEYQKINKKLTKGQPIQYILKKANFYGKEYYVNNNVLIPRPETEYLVEETNKLIKEYFKHETIRILDIGTGSGIIAITLKELNIQASITATDISKKALRVAKRNNKKHNTNIKLIKTNLYDGIENRYDVVISNPPYIDKDSKNIEQKVKNSEPHIALFAENKGLFYYEQILKNINKIIKKRHIISFEIGEDQAKTISKIAKKYLPDDEIIIKKDYNNFDRYIFIIRK